MKATPQASKGSLYFIMALWLVLAAGRETGAELWLKGGAPMSPEVLLLGFCLGALLLAAVLELGARIRKSGGRRTEGGADVSSRSSLPSQEKQHLWLALLAAVLTMVSYGLTVLSVRTSLGAAFGNFITYSTTPGFTMVAAAIWLSESFRPRRFLLGMGLGALAAGLFVFGSRADLSLGGLGAVGGAFCALGAAVCIALFQMLQKRLLRTGYSPQQLLTVRMGPLALVMAAVAFERGTLGQLFDRVWFLPYCVVFFALALLLWLKVLQQLELGRAAALQFLVPCVTYAFSLALGLKQLDLRPVLAIPLSLAAFLVLMLRVRSTSEKQPGASTEDVRAQ